MNRIQYKNSSRNLWKRDDYWKNNNDDYWKASSGGYWNGDGNNNGGNNDHNPNDNNNNNNPINIPEPDPQPEPEPEEPEVVEYPEVIEGDIEEEVEEIEYPEERKKSVPQPLTRHESEKPEVPYIPPKEDNKSTTSINNKPTNSAPNKSSSSKDSLRVPTPVNTATSRNNNKDSNNNNNSKINNDNHTNTNNNFDNSNNGDIKPTFTNDFDPVNDPIGFDKISSELNPTQNPISNPNPNPNTNTNTNTSINPDNTSTLDNDIANQVNLNNNRKSGVFGHFNEIAIVLVSLFLISVGILVYKKKKARKEEENLMKLMINSDEEYKNNNIFENVSIPVNNEENLDSYEIVTGYTDSIKKHKSYQTIQNYQNPKINSSKNNDIYINTNVTDDSNTFSKPAQIKYSPIDKTY